MPPAPVVAFSDVGKAFANGVVALDRLDLDVREGEILGLVGLLDLRLFQDFDSGRVKVAEDVIKVTGGTLELLRQHVVDVVVQDVAFFFP